MPHHDVFNGDADGISSLVQLRLATPRVSTFVTGAKRDIALVRRVRAARGDSVTVLDVSLDVNRRAVEELLGDGVAVEYFDHHYPGSAPPPAGLAAHIDTAPGVCTGILVDRHLGGTQRPWAVVAAFGDNLVDEARRLAAAAAIPEARLPALRDLGDGLTYNSYSDHLDDALVPPDDLARELIACADPCRFVAEHRAFAAIDDARRRDLDRARGTPVASALPGALAYILPDTPWARRVRGIFGNEVANAHPALAHAVLTTRDDGEYTVSVRAPRARPNGADALCRQFETGGGRAAAGGIDRLPRAAYAAFVARLGEAYP